jgi:hypothetical protein
LTITFEAVIFSYHSNQINILSERKLTNNSDEIASAFANAQSLLVYFVLFIIAQLFTVILVIDAVSETKKPMRWETDLSECIYRSIKRTLYN